MRAEHREGQQQPQRVHQCKGAAHVGPVAAGEADLAEHDLAAISISADLVGGGEQREGHLARVRVRVRVRLRVRVRVRG